MDLKTLYLCNVINSAFLGAALLFFKSRQKTYPGFGLWVVSTFLVAAGYAFSLLRLAGPEYLSILLNNLCFVFTGVLRLHGMVLYLEARRVNRAYYLLPLLELAGVTWFYWASDWLAMRVLIISLVLVFLAAMTAEVLLGYQAVRNRLLYQTMGCMYLIFSVLCLGLALVMLLNSGVSLFGTRPALIQWLYFLLMLVLETGWVLGFLMINSQRMENELRQSQDSLCRTVTKLEKSLAEVKTLSGLLPICANCKKVRDDQGYWKQIEEYVSERSDADFSHGICPDCARKLYPNLRLDKLR